MTASAKVMSGPSMWALAFFFSSASAHRRCVRGFFGRPAASWARRTYDERRSPQSAGPLFVTCSSTQTESLDQRAVALDVGRLEVAQHALAAADQQEEPTTAVVVVLVGPSVLGEVLDALRQHRDLDLGGAGVALGGGVLGHDLLLHVSVQRHG